MHWTRSVEREELYDAAALSAARKKRHLGAYEPWPGTGRKVRAEVYRCIYGCGGPVSVEGAGCLGCRLAEHDRRRKAKKGNR